MSYTGRQRYGLEQPYPQRLSWLVIFFFFLAVFPLWRFRRILFSGVYFGSACFHPVISWFCSLVLLSKSRRIFFRSFGYTGFPRPLPLRLETCSGAYYRTETNPGPPLVRGVCAEAFLLSHSIKREEKRKKNVGVVEGGGLPKLDINDTAG